MTAPTPLPGRDDERVVTASFDSEAVLYDLEANAVHLLNGTAALIWQCCDGEGTVEALVDDLVAVFDVPAADIADGVRAVLAELTDAGLLRSS